VAEISIVALGSEVFVESLYEATVVVYGLQKMPYRSRISASASPRVVWSISGGSSRQRAQVYGVGKLYSESLTGSTSPDGGADAGGNDLTGLLPHSTVKTGCGDSCRDIELHNRERKPQATTLRSTSFRLSAEHRGSSGFRVQQGIGRSCQGFPHEHLR
jgi:hypothetical protein